ncbi:MAG: hypothetical protein Q8L48_27545 [Archangium sp.]|nr:hypothetical protein [Archangium sp.]
MSILSHGREPATLAELEVLVSKGAFPEVLERAEDVAPSARSDAWKSLVTKAAAAVVQSAAVTRDAFAPALEADALAKRHPFLSEREAFMKARDGAVVSAAQRCFKEEDGGPCWKTLAAFEPTLSPPGSWELGRALRKNGALPGRVTALYAKAAAKDAAACKDADVQDVLVASLDGPVDGAPAIAARTVAFTTCWAAVQPKLKAAMVSASSYRLQNVCKPMREKKALSALQEDLCADESQ